MTRLFFITAITTLLIAGLQAADYPLAPRLVGDWWTVATDPDLGPLTNPSQQPVDFGIWQAIDGTWQIWSCIRGTKETGKTRLFYRWEGPKLTDTNWTPKGIALRADPAVGETLGGLQAPFVMRHQDQYWMFYGDWANICLATSTDGKAFTRYWNTEDKPQLNFAGMVDRDRNGRDPMVRRIGSQWFCYYTAHPGNKGFDYARTSDDLIHWSEERVVAARGKAGDGPYSAECPFVVEPQPGHFYLFRTQRYGQDAQTMVYYSRDPLDFGIDNDAEHYVTTLAVAAPEIFQFEGNWYMAALLPTLKGIQITRMEWVPKESPREKLRIIIETDAGGDPDDEQSLVRFLLYASEWDVEGIIANRPTARPGENLNPVRTGLGIVQQHLAAYGEVLHRLQEHAPGFPTKQYLWDRTVAGYTSSDAGVNLIIAAVDCDDPRPVWFQNWGTDRGSDPSNLKRALDKILAERGPSSYATFKNRIRLCSSDKFGDHTTNTAAPWRLWVLPSLPNMDGGNWYHRFGPLTAIAGGFDLHRDVLTGHGPLGALYPTNTNIRQKEGDSLLFLYLIPTGMNDPMQPSWGSWAGRFGVRDAEPRNPHYYWANLRDMWQGTTNRDNTLKRWATDLQNDFRARLDWCVKPYSEANHPPMAALNGDTSKRILTVVAKPNSTVKLTASGSADPDRYALSYQWTIYPEAGTYPNDVQVTIADPANASVFVPADAVGKEIHVILTVRDEGQPPLASYRRAVIKVDSARAAEAKLESTWRSLPLITEDKVDDGWCHVGWGGFAVDEGALRTECDPKGLGLLVYKKERFGNCQIRVLFKSKDVKCNAGVFVRIDEGILAQVKQPGAKFDRDASRTISKPSMTNMMASAEREEGPWSAVHRGYEVQIMDANDPFHRTGAIYSLAASSAVSPKAAGEWKTMIITLAGNRILVDLDGQRITRFDPNNASDGAFTATNGYTNVENYLNELAGDPIPGLINPPASPASDR